MRWDRKYDYIWYDGYGKKSQKNKMRFKCILNK